MRHRNATRRIDRLERGRAGSLVLRAAPQRRRLFIERRAYGGAHQAATHHEKLDGTGYPWGLGGDHLDQMARLLAVADVYEALTADRPYRSGMSADEALRIIERDRGKKLDGGAIDALASAIQSHENGDL